MDPRGTGQGWWQAKCSLSMALPCPPCLLAASIPVLLQHPGDFQSIPPALCMSQVGRMVSAKGLGLGQTQGFVQGHWGVWDHLEGL